MKITIVFCCCCFFLFFVLLHVSCVYEVFPNTQDDLKELGLLEYEMWRWGCVA